jgi:hypothetical protein
MNISEEVYSVKDVARILKISKAHAYELMNSDKLDTFDIALGSKESHLRITESNLRKFMEGNND